MEIECIFIFLAGLEHFGIALHMQRISADTSSPEKPGDLNKSMCTQVGSQAITTVLDQLRSEMGLLLVHFEHIHP